jgi:hypothetical protein
MAALLCTAVVMLNMLIGLISFHLFYSFWFGVAVYAFTPIWLVSFGLFFSSRWKWHELALGVFAALLVITLFAMRDLDSMAYKMATGTFFASVGAFAVSLGSITSTVGRMIRRDIRETLAKRKQLRLPLIPAQKKDRAP